MSASFDPKRRFLWKSVNPCNQPLGNHPMRTTNYLPNRQYVVSVVRVYQNQRKDRTLKKSAFFRNSTTLSASFEPKRRFLWKSLIPTCQPLITITYERLINFKLAANSFPRENTQAIYEPTRRVQFRKSLNLKSSVDHIINHRAFIGYAYTIRLAHYDPLTNFESPVER